VTNGNELLSLEGAGWEVGVQVVWTRGGKAPGPLHCWGGSASEALASLLLAIISGLVSGQHVSVPQASFQGS
jgi:hypothetical protein